VNRLATLSCTFRDATAALRMALIDADNDVGSASRAMMKNGVVSGLVRVETCSRVEWVISSSQPKWALDLLEASLRKKTQVRPSQLRKQFSAGAALHVFRTCLGLDSLVEAEGAVGKQVTRAFLAANQNKEMDDVLKALWKQVDTVRSRSRDAGLLRHNFGVQSLVKRALEERQKLGNVMVLGRGEIGRAVTAACGPNTLSFGRDRLPQFLTSIRDASAVVVCTGGHEPWLDLPPHPGLVVDVGFPPQIRSAPGWVSLPLDALLSHSQVELKADDRHQLEEFSIEGAAALGAHLQATAQRKAAGILDAERQHFFEVEWPELAKGLAPQQAAQLKQQFSAFAHRLIKRVGGES
jgi:hypothetical protein